MLGSHSVEKTCQVFYSKNSSRDLIVLCLCTKEREFSDWIRVYLDWNLDRLSMGEGISSGIMDIQVIACGLSFRRRIQVKKLDLGSRVGVFEEGSCCIAQADRRCYPIHIYHSSNQMYSQGFWKHLPIPA